MGAYKNAVLATPGLIDFWDLDELSGTSASDSGPGSLAGVYTGGITQGIAAGPSGKSCLFDGSTGRVAVATCPLDRADNLSLEVWLRTSDVSQIDQCALSYGDGQTSAQRGLAIVISGHEIAGGAISILYHGVAWQTSATVVANNVWSHIIASVDVGGALSVYHQGISLPFTGVPMIAPLAADGVCIGSQSASAGGRYFKGNLDAAALYNVPISAATALAHYNLGEFGGGSTYPAWLRNRRNEDAMPFNKRQVGNSDYPIVFDVVDSTLHVNPVSGLAATIASTMQICKPGALASVSPQSSIAEIGTTGSYVMYGAGLKTDLNTFGDLLIYVPGGATFDPVKLHITVAPNSPFN